MKEYFQSPVMFSSYMIRFTSSDIAVTVSVPVTLTISAIIPDGPPAFPCFIFLMASVTIFSVTNIVGPSNAAKLFREFFPRETQHLRVSDSVPSKHVTLLHHL